MARDAFARSQNGGAGFGLDPVSVRWLRFAYEQPDANSGPYASTYRPGVLNRAGRVAAWSHLRQRIFECQELPMIREIVISSSMLGRLDQPFGATSLSRRRRR